MVDKIKNVPAFPTEPNTQPGFYTHHGMSLRDYFAGQALIAKAGETGVYPRDLALNVYEIADAMLAARGA